MDQHALSSKRGGHGLARRAKCQEGDDQQHVFTDTWAILV